METNNIHPIAVVLSDLAVFIGQDISISGTLVASEDIRIVSNPRTHEKGIVLDKLDPMKILSSNVPVRIGGEYIWEENCVITGTIIYNNKHQPCLKNVTLIKVLLDTETVEINPQNP